MPCNKRNGVFRCFNRFLCGFARILGVFLCRFDTAFLSRFCVVAFDTLFLHIAGTRIGCGDLRVILQRLLILKFCVCLDSRFFGFCGGSIGFELVAVIPLLELLFSEPRRALGNFFAFVCRFHARIVFLNLVNLAVNVQFRLNNGVQGAFVLVLCVARRLVLFFKVKPHLCFACYLIKGAFFDDFLLLGNCRARFVETVSRLV